jgi:hypothetical protein
MKFKEWFDKKLVVGMFPITQNKHFDASKYDVVINVSDEFYFDVEQKLKAAGCNTYWFPMNECKRDIGLNSIYGAMVVIYEAEKQNKTVYLHCHAGANRSPSVWAAYHYMRTGKHIEKIRSGYINMLIANCSRGYLPPKAEMESFLTEIQTQLDIQMQGGILDMSKIKYINNF